MSSTKIVKDKLDAADLFDCENMDAFIHSIVQVLFYRGIEMRRFYICEYAGVQFLTKLFFYRKTEPELYIPRPPGVVPTAEAEIEILKIFKREIIDRNISPCILELVYSKICGNVNKIAPSKTDCGRLLQSYRSNVPQDDVDLLLCKYRDLVNEDMAYDKFAFLVMEKCDITLDDYLRRDITTPISMTIFKSLLYQIIYTMYAINCIYPKFRHYDLHTENIMLKIDTTFKFRVNDPKYIIFTVEGQKYSVPYFGIIAKIIDMGFGSLPEEGIISASIMDRHQIFTRPDNDLVFLFHWIYYTIDIIRGDKAGDVNRLLEALEPNRSYVHSYMYLVRDIKDKIPTYKQMVQNSIFAEYKKYNPARNQVYAEYMSPK